MTCEVPCPWRKAEEPSVETVVYQRTSVPCAETSPTARGADKSTDINYDSEQQFMCDDDCDSLSPQMSSASGHTSGDTNMQLASFYMWLISPDGGLKDEKLPNSMLRRWRQLCTVVEIKQCPVSGSIACWTISKHLQMNDNSCRQL